MTLQSASCNELSSQTTVNVHLIVSQSGAAALITDNFVSASDRFTAGCSSHLTSHFDAQSALFSSRQSDNRQRAFNRFTAECNSLTIRQSLSYQFFENSNNFASAFDDIDIECSLSDIRQPPVHLMTSTSDASISDINSLPAS